MATEDAPEHEKSGPLCQDRNDQQLTIMAHDVLIAPTLTHLVMTHPGNLVFSVVCQSYASKLPSNDQVIDVHPTAKLIYSDILARAGRFLRLKKDSLTPEKELFKDIVVDRIVSILVTIRSIKTMEDAMQLNIPEILFAMNKPRPLLPSPTQPNRFPLSFWFKKIHDNESGTTKIAVAPPQLPETRPSAKEHELQQASSPSNSRATNSNFATINSRAGERPKIIKLTKDLIEDAMPPTASSVFLILDRRIDFDHHAPDASLYSLLRSWVQDDPHRLVPSAGLEMPINESVLVPRSEEDDSACLPSAASKPKRLDLFSSLSEQTTSLPSVKHTLDTITKEGQSIRKRQQHAMKNKLKDAKRSLRERGITL